MHRSKVAKMAMMAKVANISGTGKMRIFAKLGPHPPTRPAQRAPLPRGRPAGTRPVGDRRGGGWWRRGAVHVSRVMGDCSEGVEEFKGFKEFELLGNRETQILRYREPRPLVAAVLRRERCRCGS